MATQINVKFAPERIPNLFADPSSFGFLETRKGCPQVNAESLIHFLDVYIMRGNDARRQGQMPQGLWQNDIGAERRIHLFSSRVY